MDFQICPPFQLPVHRRHPSHRLQPSSPAALAPDAASIEFLSIAICNGSLFSTACEQGRLKQGMSGRSLSEKSTPTQATSMSTRATRSSSSLRGDSVGRLFTTFQYVLEYLSSIAHDFVGPAALMTAACRPIRSALQPKKRAGAQTLLPAPPLQSTPWDPWFQRLYPPSSARTSQLCAHLRLWLLAALLCDLPRRLCLLLDLSKNPRRIKMLPNSAPLSFIHQAGLPIFLS